MQKKSKKRLLAMVALVLVLSISAVAAYGAQQFKAYDAELLRAPLPDTEVLSADGTRLDSIYSGELTPFADVPQNLKNAFVAIEDRRFYEHAGIDYRRIAGAVWANIKAGKTAQGGSTISQQVMKNTHLNNAKKLSRKINEALLAKKLEKHYSKDEILNIYMNVIYFGEDAYGIRVASRIYFGKNFDELNLPECATLAAIVNSPKLYSPVLHPENALSRRNLVLKRMLTQEMITQAEHNEAVNAPLNISLSMPSGADSYYLAALEEARQIMRHETLDGLRIHTAFDARLQNACQRVMSDTKYYLPNSLGKIPDGLAVIIDNSGGTAAFYGTTKGLRFVKRRPASAIKPILVFAPAIELGIITPSTVLVDEPTTLRGYSPRNFNNVYKGEVSARQALASSLNIPAVKIMNYCGVENCKKFASAAGIRFHKRDNGLALALGGFTEGISILETANTFTPFANSGNFVAAGLIDKITDTSGRLLYVRARQPKQIMHAETAGDVRNMMQSAVKDGTASKLRQLGRGLAAKTGTAGDSGGNSDANIFAISDKYVYGVWQGNLHGKENDMDLQVRGSTYPAMQMREIIRFAER